MAYTYTWNDLTNRLKPFVNRIPLGDDWIVCCDMVNGTMYKSYPWKESLQNIAASLIPLADGVQDYSVPTNISRLTKLSLVRTDLSPNQHYEIRVAGDLDVDLTPRSPTGITCGSLQAGVGLIRLESAVSIPTGSTWEIQGEIQINPNKVLALSDGFWLRDEYANVAFEGLLYFAYRLSGDARAGSAQANNHGGIVYTGQLGVFRSALEDMKSAEDFGGNDTYYPSEPMGGGRGSSYGWPRFPF